MAPAVICGNCGQPVDIPEDATPKAIFPCPWCGQPVSVDLLPSAKEDVFAEAPSPPEDAPSEDVSLIGVAAEAAGPVASESGITSLVLTEAPGADHTQTAAPGMADGPSSAIAAAQDACALPEDSPVLPSDAADPLASEAQVAAFGGLVGPSEAQADASVCALPAGPPVAACDGATPAPMAATSDLGGEDEIAQPQADGGTGVSPLSGAEEALVAVAEDEAADAAAADTDGASLAHALGDLWQEAGVAPPLTTPSQPHARASEPRDSGFSPQPFIEGSSASGLHGFSSTPQRAVGSFAARAQAQEKVGPRKLVRAVGMVISGLLAIGLTYGVFKLFGWGNRPLPPRPAASQKADPGEVKVPRPGKDQFVPDWKGLKSPPGR